MFKEAESRPDKIESTSNNVQVRKKQQHRRRANILTYLTPLCAQIPIVHKQIVILNIFQIYVNSDIENRSWDHNCNFFYVYQRVHSYQ